MNPQFAILIDGGFLRRKLSERGVGPPTADAIEAECRRIATEPAVAGMDLLRIYFYDAAPAREVLTRPLDGHRLDLGATATAADTARLFRELELRPDFALRMGETITHGWQLGPRALREVLAEGRVVKADDLVPRIEQKGVDLRIGLDIARLSLRGMVRAIVVVTGDSDLVPAFRFARREGVRVLLDHLGHGVRRELKVHSDRVLESSA